MKKHRIRTGIIVLALAASLAFAGVLYSQFVQPNRSATIIAESLETLNSLHAKSNSFDSNEFLLGNPQFSKRDIELASLGRMLFFDTRLSANQQVSCATCHQPGRSFTDGLKRARGISELERNTPTIINSFANFWFFWDGRADSLAAQAISPLENPHEHGLSRTEILRHVVEFYGPQYEALFGKIPEQLHAILQIKAKPSHKSVKLPDKIIETALPSLTNPKLIEDIQKSAAERSMSPSSILAEILEAPTLAKTSEETAYEHFTPDTKTQLNQAVANIGLAIEAYERGIIANQSPFDEFIRNWVQSTADAYSSYYSDSFGEPELAGFILFQTKGNCRLCHTGPNFSDNQFHNIALPPTDDRIDIGRSLGVQKVLADEFNCKSIFAHDADRQLSESCKDLNYLDPETPETIGSFKTPTLRNLKDTAPYMHDGRFATLTEVLRHYNLMNTMPAIGFREEVLKPLNLDGVDLDLIERFLHSLNSPIRDLTAQ